MKLVCAWCKIVIRGRGNVVSHGICPKCASEFFEPQFDFMSGLPRSVRVRGGSLRRLRRQHSGEETVHPLLGLN